MKNQLQIRFSILLAVVTLGIASSAMAHNEPECRNGGFRPGFSAGFNLGFNPGFTPNRPDEIWLGGGVQVTEASYGLNCNHYLRGNVTGYLQAACNNQQSCWYNIRFENMGGDPAYGCPKDLRISYICASDGQMRQAYVPGEAHGRQVMLSCGY